MAVDDKTVEHLSLELQSLTNSLIDDLVTSFQADPKMVELYGANLRSVAEQGVVSFRDIMLGALQFNAPGIVNTELKWLDRLLEARHIRRERIPLFLDIFQTRLKSDLSAEDSKLLLDLLERVRSRLN